MSLLSLAADGLIHLLIVDEAVIWDSPISPDSIPRALEQSEELKKHGKVFYKSKYSCVNFTTKQ